MKNPLTIIIVRDFNILCHGGEGDKDPTIKVLPTDD